MVISKLWLGFEVSLVSIRKISFFSLSFFFLLRSRPPTIKNADSTCVVISITPLPVAGSLE